jgi:predicted nucleic acid-binding protein
LRLLTQQIADGYRPLANLAAWAALDRLMEDDAVGFIADPESLDHIWRLLSATNQPSPKTWMDAYLAAFAISGSLRLVTLDRDFQKFVPHGLDLLLLTP